MKKQEKQENLAHIFERKLFSVQVWDLCMQSTGLHSGFNMCWMEFSVPSQ